MTSYEMVLKVAKLLDDKKAVDIKALEIKDLTTIGDYFVIASGTSNIQVKALADEVEEGLSKLGYEPRRIEGYQSAMWVVLDYYDVIVHIFYDIVLYHFCINERNNRSQASKTILLENLYRHII